MRGALSDERPYRDRNSRNYAPSTSKTKPILVQRSRKNKPNGFHDKPQEFESLVFLTSIYPVFNRLPESIG